ncbi:MAG: helix-turn-helix transcriptional regulator [Gemmatimonadota bacterium]|nr:helix-turn-helix transcriptional regulator [Gemmatimonadota bacterium]
MVAKVRRASGNVFHDLRFPAREAAHLKIRADLMIALTELIRARGLTQAGAAAFLGVSQPRISDLMTGKFERFSIDTLIAMLSHAGVKVRVELAPGRRNAARRLAQLGGSEPKPRAVPRRRPTRV